MGRFQARGARVQAMVPPVRSFTPLEIKDKTYQLCYDFESIMLAEDMAGCDVFDAFSSTWSFDAEGNARVAKMPNARTLACLFWAAIHVGHPEITFEESMRLIVPTQRPKIFVAIASAWAESERDPIDPANENVTPGGKAAS